VIEQLDCRLMTSYEGIAPIILTVPAFPSPEGFLTGERFMDVSPIPNFIACVGTGYWVHSGPISHCLSPEFAPGCRVVQLPLPSYSPTRLSGLALLGAALSLSGFLVSRFVAHGMYMWLLRPPSTPDAIRYSRGLIASVPASGLIAEDFTDRSHP